MIDFDKLALTPIIRVLGKPAGYTPPGETYALRRLMFSDEFPICNWVWARAYQEAIGYRFGVRAAWTTPDTMHDHVVLHSRSAVHELSVFHKKLCERKASKVIQMIPDAAGVWEKVEKNWRREAVGLSKKGSHFCPDLAKKEPWELVRLSGLKGLK